MWAFGHEPDHSVYEPALAAALPLDRREAPRAAAALAAGRLIGDMLVGILQPPSPTTESAGTLWPRRRRSGDMHRSSCTSFVESSRRRRWPPQLSGSRT